MGEREQERAPRKRQGVGGWMKTRMVWVYSVRLSRDREEIKKNW